MPIRRTRHTSRGSGSPRETTFGPDDVFARPSSKLTKPPVPARVDAISVLQRQHQELLAKAATIDRAIRAQQQANASAKVTELVIVPPPRGSSKKSKTTAPVPPSPAPDRWSRVVPPDTALTFAAVWDPDDGMVTFSKPHLRDSPPQTSRAPRLRPGEYSCKGDVPLYDHSTVAPSVPKDTDGKSTILSIDLIAAALGGPHGEGALPSAAFPKDIDARSAVLTIDLLAAALTTPGPDSSFDKQALNTARLALDIDANRAGPMNFACEALDGLSAYLDAFFPGGVPPVNASDSDGTSSVGLEAWVRKSLLPKLAESGEEYQLDWSALDDLEKRLIHDPRSALMEEWKGAKSVVSQEPSTPKAAEKKRGVLVRGASAGSSGSKGSSRNRSVEDEGFYEVPRKASPRQLTHNSNFVSSPIMQRQESIVEDEPNMPSSFTMTTTSTSNYVDVGFPTPLPMPEAFRLPPIRDLDYFSDSASDIERDKAHRWPGHYTPDRSVPPVPKRSQSQGVLQTPPKRRFYKFSRSASETTPPRRRPSSPGTAWSPQASTPALSPGTASAASIGSPRTPCASPSACSPSVSPVSPAEVLSRPTYNHTSMLTPPTPLNAHYTDLAASQKPISGPMALLPVTVRQIPSVRRKASMPGTTPSSPKSAARKLIKGKLGSLRSKMRPFHLDEEEGAEDDDQGWVGVTIDT